MGRKVRLPGLIDVHTHLREPGATQKEDFESGSKAAIAGGYTAILDMPNNPIPTTTPEALDQKINLAKGRLYCDVGFNFGATANNSEILNQVQDRVFGLKVYMNHTTGDLLMEDEMALEDVFSKWPKGKVIMVHAEGETLQKAINLAKKFGSKLHVCHVSTKFQIELIKKAKQEGLEISCEVSCHHLFLTSVDGKKLGPYGMMRPPLASAEDQQALWNNMDVIDMIASDHAPHTKDEKSKIPTPNGVPGLETSLPLLLTAVNEGKLTIERLIELTSKNPRRIFNIPEQKETFVEVDMTIPYTLTSRTLYTKCHWTPFEGRKVVGKIKKVVLRGKVVFENGQVFGPYGQILSPGVTP